MEWKGLFLKSTHFLAGGSPISGIALLLPQEQEETVKRLQLHLMVSEGKVGNYLPLTVIIAP